MTILNRYEGAFNFPFHIGKNSLSIIQHGEKFDLRVNNQSFEHMYNQRKYKFLNDKSYVKMLEDWKNDPWALFTGMQKQHFRTDEEKE